MITDRIKDPPDLTPDEIKRALSRPDSFAYFGDEKSMFESWALGPVIEHRDSGLVDRSNARVLRRELAKHPEWSDDYRIESASHWAVGHVTHLSYRVIDAEGKATPIARFVRAWFKRLADEYPIADDDDHSTLEWETSMDWIDQEGPRMADRLGFKLPDEWFCPVKDWWDANRPNALENVDDHGASPSDDDWRAAFEGCGFAREE